MKVFLKLIMGMLLVFFLASCSSNPKVGRVSTDEQIDLSGYWNDTDVRLACESLITACLNSPRVDQAIKAMGGKTPMVIVGRFRNDSSEHIDTSIISRIMESTIFNSGKMDFVAGGSTRDELRSERQDQLSNASDYTASSIGNETGADFMLTGKVTSIIDRAGNLSVRAYFVNAELTNIETNQRMWMGDYNEIKKTIKKPKARL